MIEAKPNMRIYNTCSKPKLPHPLGCYLVIESVKRSRMNAVATSSTLLTSKH